MKIVRRRTIAFVLYSVSLILLLAPAATSRTPTSTKALASHDWDLHLLKTAQDGTLFEVTIHPLFDEGVGPETAGRARAELLARFPPAFRLSEGEATTQSLAIAARWPAATTSWAYNQTDQPASLPDARALLVEGASAWDYLGGSGWHWAPSAQLTTADTGACAGTFDGKSTVGWRQLPKAEAIIVLAGRVLNEMSPF